MNHNTKEEMYSSIKRDEFMEDTLTVEDLIKKGGEEVALDYVDAIEELGKIYQAVFDMKSSNKIDPHDLGMTVEALVMEQLEKIVEGEG